MRVLGFSKKWDKLQNPEFTTFRFPRKDSDKGRDWNVGEQVQIVFHPRGKDREFICIAQIISKEPRSMKDLTNIEACMDGFKDATDMFKWMVKTYGYEILVPMNKLTLRRKEAYMPIECIEAMEAVIPSATICDLKCEKCESHWSEIKLPENPYLNKVGASGWAFGYDRALEDVKKLNGIKEA